MSEIVKVALDCMGGDNAPGEIVKGAVLALEQEKNLFVYAIGQEEVVLEELSKYDLTRLLQIFEEASDKILLNAERKLLFDSIAQQIISYI